MFFQFSIPNSDESGCDERLSDCSILCTFINLLVDSTQSEKCSYGLWITDDRGKLGKQYTFDSNII